MVWIHLGPAVYQHRLDVWIAWLRLQPLILLLHLGPLSRLLRLGFSLPRLHLGPSVLRLHRAPSILQSDVESPVPQTCEQSAALRLFTPMALPSLWLHHSPQVPWFLLGWALLRLCRGRQVHWCCPVPSALCLHPGLHRHWLHPHDVSEDFSTMAPPTLNAVVGLLIGVDFYIASPAPGSTLVPPILHSPMGSVYPGLFFSISCSTSPSRAPTLPPTVASCAA